MSLQALKSPRPLSRFCAGQSPKVRDLNFKYLSEGKGATVTARFGKDGITICDPNRASEGADKVFQRIYEKAI